MDYSISGKNINTKTIFGYAVVMLAVLLAVLLIVQPATAQETPPLSSPLPGTDTDPASCPHNPGGGNCNTDVSTAPVGNLPQNTIGNPINLMTGNKHQSEVDFAIPGSMLSLRRMYNSSDADSNRGLGQGWSHSYTVTLLNAGDGNLQIAQSDGGRINFYPDGADENGYPLYRAHQSNHGYLTFENERYYWHLSDGRTLKFNGQFLVHIDWPDQRELKLYYRQKRLSTVTDETGRVLQFAYTGGSRAEALPAFEASRFGTAEGYLESVTLPDGNVIGYDYDNKRNLTRVRYPDGTNREYHYENESWPNHLTGLTDRTGVRFASWTYDEQGRADSSEHAGGVESVDLLFPDANAVADGQVVQTQVTNSLGHTSTYTWKQDNIAANPRLLSSEGAGCATCPETGYEYTYDGQGRLLNATKTRNGNATGDLSSVGYQYSEKGLITDIRKTDSAGQGYLLERREYVDNSHLLSRIIRSGVNPDDDLSIDFEYDNNGNAVSVTERGYTPIIPADAQSLDANSIQIDAYEPIERTTRLQWNGKQLVSIDGPRTDIEDTVLFQWDENNRLVSVAPPLSPALSIERFDAMGRAVLIRLGQQTPVELEYNLAGQLVSTRQNAKTLTFGYDREGRLNSISDPFNRNVSIEHDEAGRLTAFTDDMGQRKQIEYDTESQRLSEQLLGIGGESLSLLTMLFDEKGHISQTRREQAGDGDSGPRISTANHQQLLDGTGTSTVDAQTGGDFNRSLDMVNRVATFTNGAGLQEQIGFDTQGRHTSVTDKRGNVTRHWYDDFGRRVLSVSSDTGVQVSRFDAADNLLERTNGDGSVLRYQHDAANRQTQRVDGVSTTTLSWDANNGKLIESSNDYTTERFAYDKEARLIEHVRLIDGHSFRTAYQYDGLGRVTEKELPDGQRLYHWYHEDGVNRGSLRAITTGGILGVGQQTIVAEIDLEKRDGSTGYLAGNGVRSNYTYAADGQVSSIEIGGSLVMGFGFDEQGRIIRIDENGQSQQYQWQGNRLSQANTLLGDYTYQYDALSNRTASTVSEQNGDTASENYLYPPEGGGNRLLSRQAETAVQFTDYEYNGAGSVTRQGVLSFTYDALQRPVEVYRSDQLIAQYAYNSFGERIKKIVYDDQGNATTTYFLFDGKSLSAQANEQGQLIDQYVYLEGHRPIARLTDNEVQAIHTDHRGAPRLVTDSQTQVIWQASYSPFGEAKVTIAQIDLPHRLPGQQLDAETGLHYNYFRHYDPSTGRYTTSDPLGLIAGFNTYGYVGGNPLSLIDPTGLLVFLPPAAVLFYTTVSGAVGALATWVGGLTTAQTLVSGTAVSLVALAVYFKTQSGGNEAAFTQEMGGAKPTTADFNALRDQAIKFNPSFNTLYPQSVGNLSWDYLFFLQAKLLEEQRAYIASCAVGTDHDDALLTEAKDAVAAADAAEEDATTATPTPPNCEELGRQTREALFDNKHDRDGDGGHGYLRRMLEQICGANGPPSNSFAEHMNQLKGERNNIEDAEEGLDELGCSANEVSRRDRLLRGKILNQRGWTPETIEWLGRDHPQCSDWESIARGDDNGRLIQKLLEITRSTL